MAKHAYMIAYMHVMSCEILREQGNCTRYELLKAKYEFLYHILPSAWDQICLAGSYTFHMYAYQKIQTTDTESHRNNDHHT